MNIHLKPTLLCVVCLLLTGCPQGGGPSRPVQYLQFNYLVLPSTSDGIESLHDQIRDHGLTFEDAMLSESSDTPCEYMATFAPTIGQTASTVPLDQRTKAPDIQAYGDANDTSFNFILDAFQSRTMRPLCSSLAETVQGLSMVSLPAPVDGQWRSGDSVSAIFRPDMATDLLGSEVEFDNVHEGDTLLFEFAVDSVSGNGYVQGRFRFLAASEDGDRLLIANDGAFGLLR